MAKSTVSDCQLIKRRKHSHCHQFGALTIYTKYSSRLLPHSLCMTFTFPQKTVFVCFVFAFTWRRSTYFSNYWKIHSRQLIDVLLRWIQ